MFTIYHEIKEDVYSRIMRSKIVFNAGLWDERMFTPDHEIKEGVYSRSWGWRNVYSRIMRLKNAFTADLWD